MKSRLALTFLLLTASLTADTDPKAAAAAEVMRAYGVAELLESTQQEVAKQADGALQNAFAQIQAAMPQMSEESWGKVREAGKKYIQAATGGWDGASLAAIYAKVYEDNYSLEELQALSAYLKTEAGAKSIRVEKLATKLITEAIVAEMTKSLQPALRTFMAEVQAIVGDEMKRLQEAAAK